MDLWSKLKAKTIKQPKEQKKPNKKIPDNEPKKKPYTSPAYERIMNTVLKEKTMLEKELTNIRLGTLRQRKIRRRRVKVDTKENVINSDTTQKPVNTADKKNNKIEHINLLNQPKAGNLLKDRVNASVSMQISEDRDRKVNGNTNKTLSLIEEENKMYSVGEIKESQPLNASQGVFVQADGEARQNINSGEGKHTSKLSPDESNTHVRQWIESLPDSLAPVSIDDSSKIPEPEKQTLPIKPECKSSNDSSEDKKSKKVVTRSDSVQLVSLKMSGSRGSISRRSTGSIEHIQKGGFVNPTASSERRRPSLGSKQGSAHSSMDDKKSRSSSTAIDAVAAAQSQQGSAKSDQRSVASKSDKETKAGKTPKNAPVKEFLTNPDLYNPDGTFRTKLTMPSMDKRWEQAKKARYIRSKDVEVVERERELAVPEIFAEKGKNKNKK